ncbi:MAG: TrbI/VirB10 family protein, partial [Gammaproteobacteria bacterium]
RDKNGNVVGKVGPDGLVRDTQGKVIGKAGSGAAAGALIYDDKGNVMGSLGPDGLVRDNNGKVIGKVGPDGFVRDAKGQVIGKAGSAGVGALVYSSDGRLIGRVGIDGLVRDPVTGAILGKVGPDGILRNANGQEEGRVGPPPAIVPPPAPVPVPSTPALPMNTSLKGALDAVVLPSLGTQPSSANEVAETRLKAAMERQEAAMTEQQRAQMQQAIQAAMTAQANQLFAAWAPPEQSYVMGTPDEKEGGKGADAGASSDREGSSGSAAEKAGKKPLLAKAGSISFAVLDTAVNTDEPGPILATIVDGKLKGYKLMGKVDRVDKKAMLTFTLLTGEALPSKVSINAVAIDPDTARTGVASEVNSHYWLRYGSLFGAALLQGYSTALMASGATTTINILGGTTTTTPPLSSKQKLMTALGTVGTRYQAVMGSNFNTPPTVQIHSGVGLGILFLDDVAEPV